MVEKSLVEVAGDRYRMLRTIQSLCAERLAEAGETERLRRAHAEHFHRLLGEAAPHLLRAEQLGWLARLDAERDNLNAALHWAAGADPALGLRLFGDLSTYWWLRGRRAEGIPPARALLAALDGPPEGLAGEYVLCLLGAALPAPEQDLDRASELMLSVNLVETRPQLVFFWSMAMGPANEALADTIAARMRESADPWIAGLDHLGRGVLAFLTAGDLAESERQLRLSIERFSSLGERWGMMTAISQLADLMGWLGEGERCVTLMGEALRLAEELGSLEDRAELLCRRADGLIMLGDLEAAMEGCEEALELATGAVEATTKAMFGLARLARLNGDRAGARARYEDLSALPEGSYGGGLDQIQAQVALGWIAAEEGERAEAAHRQSSALARALELRSRPHMALAVEGLAGVAVLSDDCERAALLLGAARGLRGVAAAGDHDVARVSAQARARLGEERYARAYEQGSALSRDDLITLVRPELSESG
ncbi:hypothetical protein [Nonomuraea sp. NPDC049784]|uniref:hypothetical protein n=1 Tax=Nonomuraea sp. NPDC049784 TaxID=3154361 RepID=UPI0033DDA249